MIEEIWLCLCIGQGDEETFAFSSFENAAAFADKDETRAHVIYSRIVDHPEVAEMSVQ